MNFLTNETRKQLLGDAHTTRGELVRSARQRLRGGDAARAEALLVTRNGVTLSEAHEAIVAAQRLDAHDLEIEALAQRLAAQPGTAQHEAALLAAGIAPDLARELIHDACARVNARKGREP